MRSIGGDGIDTVSYLGSVPGVFIDLNRVSGQRGGDARGDVLVSVENIVGSRSADVLLGNGADNVFDGRGGDDRLSGRDGDDTLIGGKGSDMFVFAAHYRRRHRSGL